MARIRSVKPELFQHEELAELSPLHRFAFVGLFTQADRAGLIEDRPRRIKLNVLPYDDCDFDQVLDELAAAGFIIRYGVQLENGVGRYIALPAWTKHQRPHPNEPLSTLPSPARAIPETTNGIREHCSSNTRDIPETPSREGRRVGKGKVTSDRLDGALANPSDSPASPSEDGTSEKTDILLEESARAMVESFREDYRDNVDAEYRFPAQVCKAELRAAKGFLRDPLWDPDRIQRLKTWVMTDQETPQPGKKWRGWAFQVRSLAKLWECREDLEARLIRGK